MNLITFDDIENQFPTDGTIPDGYKNLRWTNAEYINVSTTELNSVYRNAARSLPFVMYNPHGYEMQVEVNEEAMYEQGFQLESVFMAGVLPYPQVVSVVIGDEDVYQTFSASFVGPFTAQIYCTAGCVDIHKIQFKMTVNSSHSHLVRADTHLIIDNLCVLV